MLSEGYRSVSRSLSTGGQTKGATYKNLACRASRARVVAHGFRQLARASLSSSHSRNLGSGIYELQRGVAGIEPTAGAPASRRQAVVPNDRREAACPSGTDRAHFYSASTRPRLTAPTDLPRIGARQIGIHIVCARRRNTR